MLAKSNIHHIDVCLAGISLPAVEHTLDLDIIVTNDLSPYVAFARGRLSPHAFCLRPCIFRGKP